MMKLYEQVASNLQGRVEQGYYQSGDKLPSIRATSQEQGVSISTAQEAYGLLVDSGLVQVKPKSGYYVCEHKQRPQLPRISRPIPKPSEAARWQEILHMLKYADDKQAVSLNRASPDVNSPSLKPLLKITSEVNKACWSELLAYGPLQGKYKLRHQIARLMIDSGCSIHPDEVVVTTGCQEALTCILRAITQPGDIILVDSPIFFGSLQAIEMNRVKALEIPTDAETGISLEALELALEQWPVKACLLNPTNNNPLGYTMPDSHKIRLLALLRKYDIPVIEDDVYGDLTYSVPRPRTIKSFDNHDQVIYCSSFSKSIATGLRVGWVIPGKYLEKVTMAKYISSMNTPSLNQLAIAEFLAQGYYEKHLRKTRLINKRDRDIMLNLLRQYMPQGTRVSYPQGGYLLWVEMPKAINSIELRERALAEGVSIAPGSFFSTTDKYSNYMRLNSINSAEPSTQQAVKTLGRICHDLL
ncbi:PLP-dependent aminotransferase family protein [Gammaproteobacteria bacterium AS21]|mgnify:CR=1 FL=1